jgi:hypothetical protein
MGRAAPDLIVVARVRAVSALGFTRGSPVSMTGPQVASRSDASSDATRFPATFHVCSSATTT